MKLKYEEYTDFEFAKIKYNDVPTIRSANT